MQPVLATNGECAHGILAEVLIDLNAAVFEINLQPCPLVDSVLAGFGEFALSERSETSQVTSRSSLCTTAYLALDEHVRR
jgi:hypothetical protein